MKNDPGKAAQAAAIDDSVPDDKQLDPAYVKTFGTKVRILSCHMHDCENDLHCFFAKNEKKLEHPRGCCQGCGRDLVHWETVRVRDIVDPRDKLKMMEIEMLRHYYWHADMDDRTIQLARTHGRRKLRDMVRTRIISGLASANPFRDGATVSFKYHPTNYARHATATCCRTCVEYWHGIERGRPLTDDEINRLVRLAEIYIEERFADIPEIIPKTPRPKRPKRQDPKWTP